MARHPYHGIPNHQLWRRSIADVPIAQVDPVVAGKFKISIDDKVATAGSCFAQHIARHLRNVGFGYLVTEAANPLVPAPLAETYNYGVFTARYGNIYTTRQLLQTIQRAYGEYLPVDDVWEGRNGRAIDPFRPQIQPEGFSCLDEFQLDRQQHFSAIRRAIEQLDVLVFTLGLTECWYDRRDGAVFPVCPGVAGGKFDDSQYAFANLSVAEVTADLRSAICLLRIKNPSCRVILTVSPVPLVATAMDRSVLVSTTYSKSVLRVAAEEVAASDASIAYFPSYEIITGNFSRGAYFAEDLRSVTETGVRHVMRLFLKHYTDQQPVQQPVAEVATSASVRDRIDEAVAVICDEEVLAGASGAA